MKWSRVVLVCLFFALCVQATGAWAADTDGFRPYFALRLGQTVFTTPDNASGTELSNPLTYPAVSMAFGANLNRHWGVELAVDYAETGITPPGLTNRIGEYSIWTLIPQIRYRYPLLEEKLVPYVVVGAGVGIGEFNDRDPKFERSLFVGGQDTSPVAAAGVGLEYFVANNIALGMEAKHVFLFATDVSVAGRQTELDLDSTFLSAGMRLFFDAPTEGGKAGASRSRAYNSDELRGYFAIRTGKAFYTGSTGSLESPTLIDFGVALGVNINRHWGVEVSGELFETNLSSPEFGEIAEYSVATFLAHLRYRYPILNGRLVPYVLAGGGVGVSEINDARKTFELVPLVDEDSTKVIGSIGAGVEYFLSDNIAFGIESRHLFGIENDFSIGGERTTVDADVVLLSASLRILFP